MDDPLSWFEGAYLNASWVDSRLSQLCAELIESSPLSNYLAADIGPVDAVFGLAQSS